MQKEHPPEILVITLPHSTIRSAAQKYNVYKYIDTLPVKLPESIWSKGKKLALHFSSVDAVLRIVTIIRVKKNNTNNIFVHINFYI